MFLQDIWQTLLLQCDTALKKKKKFFLGSCAALDSNSGFNMSYCDMDNRDNPCFRAWTQQSTNNITLSQLHKEPSLWTLQVFE